MGRSGTSALARVLSLCGGSLPAQILPANEANPEGYWEPAEADRIDEAFLFANGSTWFDPSFQLQGEVNISPPEREAFIHRVSQLLMTWPRGNFLVVKEPRITALADLWFEAAQRQELAVKVVLPVRHPEEVIASLIRRDRMSRELATMLWLKYTLLAERQSRAVPRVFVSYRTLLDDWRGQFARISKGLSLPTGNVDSRAINSFLRPDLYRERYDDREAWDTGPLPLAKTFAIMLAAAADVPLDMGSLDHIFSQFSAYESTVRRAWIDFQQRFGPPTKMGRHCETIEMARSEQARADEARATAESENAKLRADNDALNTEATALRTEGTALRIQVNALRLETDSLQHKIADIHGSMSWRFTAPIRAIKTRFVRRE
jgi:hypothetical protein